MDLPSSLSGTKEFRIVKRGYDPDEVDAFLDQIAMSVAELRRKLAEASEQAAQAPGGAGPAADTDEIHRALILAQRTADEEVRRAAEESERIVAEARERAEGQRHQADDDVAQRREEGRAELLAEITELEGVREALSNDVVVLERHVDEQREVVQAAISELQSLLDHPEAFRIAAATGISTATVPAEAKAAPAAEEAVADRSKPAPPDVDGTNPSASPPSGSESGAGEETRPAPLPDPPAAPDDRDGALSEPPRPPGPPAADRWVTATRDADPEPASEGGSADPSTVGQPTQAVAPVGGAEDEDAFLAELRKAMLDDEPLGPRDETSAPTLLDDVDERSRSRFGRRR